MAPAQGWHANSWSVPNFLRIFIHSCPMFWTLLFYNWNSNDFSRTFLYAFPNCAGWELFRWSRWHCTRNLYAESGSTFASFSFSTALRRGDNVTNEALPRCVYCWLKTFPNCPRYPLKHGWYTQFLNAPRGLKLSNNSWKLKKTQFMIIFDNAVGLYS